MCKKSVQILILIIILLPNSAFSQTGSKLKFGLNPNIFDPTFNKILLDTISYKDFYKKYYIDYLRFPGGSNSRIYFWDKPELINNALSLFSNYLSFTGSRVSKKQKYLPQEHIYNDFLLHCKQNNIIPIVQLNTTYFHIGDSIFQIETFKKGYLDTPLLKNRYKYISQNIIAQLEYTHTIIDKVIWEIGNEDYFVYTADTYAKIVGEFIHLIKQRWPEDKVIVEMASDFWYGGVKSKFNKELIVKLNNKNLLDKIDFFAPHFYPDRTTVMSSEELIIKKIENSNPVEYENHLLSFFPNLYKPSFFYTEFAIFKKAYNHPNYSTQVHALLMLNYLIGFYASDNLFGIIHHGFTQRPSALFYPNMSVLSDRNTILTDSQVNLNSPPEALAISLFFKDVGEEVVKYINKEDFVALVTQTKYTIKVQILNYTTKSQKIYTTELGIQIRNDNDKYGTILFDDLYSKTWELFIKKYKMKEKDNIILPKYSYTYFSLIK